MKAVLNAETISTLVSPTGANDSLVQALYLKEYQKTLVRLSQLKRRLIEEAPLLVKQVGLAEAIQFIGGFPTDVQKSILNYPAVSFWLDVAWDLIGRKSHLRFPEMHMRMHLEEFWRFALAASIKANSCDFQCVTWSDAEGHISLPGTGTYWEAINRLPYQKLKMELHKGVVNAHVERGKSTDKVGLIRRDLPTLSNGFEINAIDKDLRLPGRTDFEYEQLDLAAIVRWQTTLEQAWKWICETSPQLSEEMLISTKVIVPVVSPSPDVHISATFREAPGLMALSWTPDTSIMVEAIVHEYHHQKLNGIFNLDPLILGPSTEALYYSPWRKDPRPLTGLLHGAYVFQAVLEFWRRFFAAGIPLLHTERVQQRLYLIKGQVRTALETLKKETEFSGLGNALLQSMFENLDRYSLDLPHIDEAVKRRIDDLQRQHYVEWHEQNKHVIKEKNSINISVENSNSSIPITEQVLNWLQLRSNFDLLQLNTSRFPVDPLLNSIIAAYYDEQLEGLASIVDGAKLGDSSFIDLVCGHTHYVLGHYEKAAVAYASCLGHDGSNPYFWECFAFSLRHLNRWDQAEQILVNLGQLTTNHLLFMSRNSNNYADPVEQQLQYVQTVLGI